MTPCGSCGRRYDGTWGFHTRSLEHQDWMRRTGQSMARMLKQLDTIYASAKVAQEKRSQGQLSLFDQ